MSAVLSAVPVFRPMRGSDLDAVLAIERAIYTHPWTPGNFRDSLQAGYSCWVIECGGHVAGYGVLMIGVREAHLLNLSVAAGWQRRGLGRSLLHHFIDVARGCEAQHVFLEVRPSNVAARWLYADTGFRELYVRHDYYPAGAGREDAILMALDL
ncbi:MAG TPA: ribosomal protein S18-alanine N-acetyltransferase [Burkholderiales bacterium]|nr:ribosomal protein S18-alanine N-acetyltransferase [Burkholderiales bacterium]